MDEKTLKMLIATGRAAEAYTQRVGQLVRARYSINDELAILRQREDKPEEFRAYNDFAEACKVQAHREVYGE